MVMVSCFTDHYTAFDGNKHLVLLIPFYGPMCFNLPTDLDKDRVYEKFYLKVGGSFTSSKHSVAQVSLRSLGVIMRILDIKTGYSQLDCYDNDIPTFSDHASTDPRLHQGLPCDGAICGHGGVPEPDLQLLVPLWKAKRDVKDCGEHTRTSPRGPDFDLHGEIPALHISLDGNI